MLKSVFIWCYIGVLFVKQSTCDYRRHPHWPKVAEKVCGESYSDRIIGGKFATLGQYPWMARLVHFDLDTNSSLIYCGGSLVSELFVVSAAHCLLEDYVLDSVILGEYDERTDPDCDDDFCAQPIQQIKAVRVAHPTFDSELIINDIMVIKLERPVKFNDWVSPICLPTGFEKFGSSVEVAGWGNTQPMSDSVSPILKRIKIPIVDLDKCRALVDRKMYRETQICAGSTTVNDDSCTGDRYSVPYSIELNSNKLKYFCGGPLMSVYSANRNYGPRYYLTGVVSYGSPVCGLGPAVYSNVTAFMPFVLKAMHTHKTKKKAKCKTKTPDKFQMKEVHGLTLVSDKSV